MRIRIEFDDSNKKLAKAIGLGLAYYADPAAALKLIPIEGKPADEDTPIETAAVTETVTDEPVIGTSGGEPADLPDERQAEPVKTITPDNKGPELIPPGPVETDEHGVPFDAAFCGKSDKPFYATGPRTGQWKKKRGTDQDEYDLWYDGQRPTNNAAADPEKKVDTAAAFATEPAAATTDLPTTPGDLMKWCAEQTAAGAMTTEQVTAAYAACGITVADMFGAEGETHVQAILAELTK